ncbi:hypothetical protein PENTCL1PPCAC_4874, partial [Pristionchus entomophagus]
DVTSVDLPLVLTRPLHLVPLEKDRIPSSGSLEGSTDLFAAANAPSSCSLAPNVFQLLAVVGSIFASLRNFSMSPCAYGNLRN